MPHVHEIEQSSLGHVPHAEKWTFDQSVTDVFADMLRRSIPLYDVMRQAVHELGTAFVQAGTHIVDLGCSRGDALAPFVERYAEAVRYVGVDVSAPMLEAARRRFEKEIAAGVVSITDTDLRAGYPQVKASLTLSVLTLQFTPINHRQRILQDVYQSTVPGGAMILVEKVLGATAEIDRVMIERYHTLKRSNGYSQEEIERKRLALEGVLVPVTARWNEELLHVAGFQEIDCFWRWMNFAGWVAVKRG
jgi:tRNA (cmo5U34)-methyltransferase